MSDSPAPARRSREMQIMRVLFDRHLLDRAVNLAEARWAGSGDMVRLAYAWPELSQDERRQRLEDIEPQKLAQFRAFAELHPDLSRVLDELETQGVLPPPEPEPGLPQSVSAAPEETLTDPDDDGGPGIVDDAQDDGDSPPVEAFVLDDPSQLDLDMPDLELAAESVDEFLTSERQRRAEAVASGAEMLERVRARLDQTARTVTSTAASAFPARIPAAIPAPSAAIQAVVAKDGDGFIAPPDYWVERLKQERVVVAGRGNASPSDDELVALANELGLGFVEFTLETGATRAVFGGLSRQNGTVEVAVGPLPTALAKPNLVIVRGRLYSKMLERLRAGYCDIPGTRATVKLDPATRVLVITV